MRSRGANVPRLPRVHGERQRGGGQGNAAVGVGVGVYLSTYSSILPSLFVSSRLNFLVPAVN